MDAIIEDFGEIMNKYNKKNNRQKNQKNNVNIQENTVSNKFNLKWLWGIVVSVVVTISGLIFGYIQIETYFSSKFDRLEDKIANNATIDNFNKLENRIEDVNKRLYANETAIELIQQALNMKSLVASTEMIDETANVSSNDIPNVKQGFDATTVVGTDENGIEYIAEDLIGETIILNYKDDGKDVFFLGQYNDKYYWDGYCVTNAYNPDETLFGICEYNLDNGKWIDYLSFSQGDNGDWIYTKRIIGEIRNSGLTIRYQANDNVTRNFTSANVRTTDFCYVEDYVKSHAGKMIMYYSGDTYNNYFDDETGEAYLAIYYNDGTIKTLYKGKFVDGAFEDETGNAWDIAYSEELSGYVCNTGVFKDGYAVKSSNQVLTVDEIQKIIGDNKFECELNWRQ